MDERGARLIGALLEQRYRVDALLARGGMSSVYRGLDTRLDRAVAIKVMDARFADDRTFVDRFEREARSAAKIHHPNVVAVHDQGVDRMPDGNLVYLVMELVDGGTLRDLITERGALEVPVALSIMERVLAALAAAHRAGLVHRDVKPENVLIGHGGEQGTVVKVGDFGLVRATSSAGTTSSSIILGTVAYLSPEQVTTGAASVRGDVYSAGIVLYEALTGAPPYSGDNPLSVAYRHVNEDVPPPSVSTPAIPDLLDELVVRATRRDPAARPADGAAFGEELASVRSALSLPRAAIPVPEPTIADRTVPVSPAERARAFEPPPSPADPNAATANALAPVDLGDVTAPARPPTGATIVRPAPAGFSAVGPQGTRAMLRPSPLEELPPSPVDVGPPSVPVAAQLPQPMPAAMSQPMPRQLPPGMPPGGGRPMPPRQPRRRGNVVLWTLVIVLALALGGTTTWWFTAGRWATVPDVAGKSADDATKALLDADLKADQTHEWSDTVKAGIVIRTEPGSGKDVLRGDSVKLVVSSGQPRVPDVQPGTSLDAAKQAITDAQLTPDTDDGANTYDDNVPAGKVLGLDPPGGTPVKLGERIVIILSKGPEPKPIPDLHNQTKDDAFQALQDLGYEPYELPQEFAGDVEAGRVVRTDPPANQFPGDDKRVGVVLSNAIKVPDVSQQPRQNAEDALHAAGLDVDVQSLGGDGRVFAQNPPANTLVQPGTKVTIWVVP